MISTILESNILNTEKYICLVAGKSGGHIIPALTYATNILKDYPEYKILFFSTDSELDINIINQYPIVTKHIPLKLANFPGIKVWKYPIFIFQFILSLLISFKYLFKLKPIQVISFGGYISIPVAFSAFLQRINFNIFELNAVPGKAVKFMAPMANKILICFPQAKKFFNKDKILEINYPLRFIQKDKISKINASILLDIDLKKITLLILGGSQGSQFMNNLIINFLNKYSEFSNLFHIIHQTGAAHIINIEKFYKQSNISAQVFDFLPELKLYYNAADLVISRAGAGTLFEINFFNKKSIIIPLQTANTNHQWDNAHAMAEISPHLFSIMNQELITENPQEFYNLILQEIKLNNLQPNPFKDK